MVKLARPIKPKLISEEPKATYFKPRGIPVSRLEEVRVSMEELEALRLIDLERMYQEDAAREMGISRPTIQRMVTEARSKLVEALLGGKALRIAGGHYILNEGRGRYRCGRCGDAFKKTGRGPDDCGCPHCKRLRAAGREGRRAGVKSQPVENDDGS